MRDYTPTARDLALSTDQTDGDLAAGTYLVGDPCYAFTNDGDASKQWGTWLHDAWKHGDGNHMKILDGRVNGMRVAASGTAYGDGVYSDQDGFEYGVDAGLLGAVHIGFIRNLFPERAHMTHGELQDACGMRVVEFPKPFSIEFDPADGEVRIGHISIITGDNRDENFCEHCGMEDCDGECLEG